MSPDAYIVLGVILVSVILFITEWITIDLVAMLMVATLVITGVLSPQEGVSGFSNSATIAVALMFVISAAVMKTGILQYIGPRLAGTFNRNFSLGLVVMMFLVGIISAFMNNTPVVAVLIPVVVQIARMTGKHPARMLIPLSFASMFGGTCSLIGTSTNIQVSGIAEEYGLEGFGLFDMTPLGIVFLIAGIIYLVPGIRLIPKRELEDDLSKKFGLGDYVTEIKLKSGSPLTGKKLMNVPFIRQENIEVMEVRRGISRFGLPQGDFRLEEGDILKIRCNVEMIKQMKDDGHFELIAQNKEGSVFDDEGSSSLVEFVISSTSYMDNKKLGDLDFRRKFRAAPLAIRQRQELLNEGLDDVRLKAGDVILAEVKSHYIKKLKELEKGANSPFLILSQEGITQFDKNKFAIVGFTLLAMILATGIFQVPILTSAIGAAAILLVSQTLRMKEFYNAINWKVVFLLAGTLSLGIAMQKSGLADAIAHQLLKPFGQWGPVAAISALYLFTSLLTSVMSNNATAALLAPIAIVMAEGFEMSSIPFLMAVTFAASASFITPVGYQTNIMIFSAGGYKFSDFFRVGIVLHLLFWVLATILIPVFYF